MGEDELYNLMSYDGRRYRIVNGWCIRFRFWMVETSIYRPHGIKYSLTLHDESMKRLLGYDNAHGIARYTEYDHRHPFRREHELLPYAYTDGYTLIADFFNSVKKACTAEGITLEYDGEFELEDEDVNDHGEEDDSFT